MKNRVAWALAVILAAGVLDGIGTLCVRLRPYWVAKYRGEGADLQGAFLRGACLHKADLGCANLRGAILQRADLTSAGLQSAKLDAADLRGADLRGADFWGTEVQGADLRGADLRGATLEAVDFTETKGLLQARLDGARYCMETRWPRGFDPRRHGARFMLCRD